MSQILTGASTAPARRSRHSPRDLYANRKLAEGYPAMEAMALKQFSATLDMQPDETARIELLIERLNRLIDLAPGMNIAVVGCGPKPCTLRVLSERQYNVIGIEPVASFVTAARAYLQNEAAVVTGAAENIPLPDGSQHLVLCDSVLEHVISPTRSLMEMQRVLAPGGIAYIATTNKYKFSIRGRNGEYVFPFFNWLPRLLKECLVFQHLHYKPALANYSQFPAVHWFTYSELCRLGREAGFARFYSPIDLLDDDDPTLRRKSLKQWLVNRVKYNPLLRAIALTQRGNAIVMLKN